MAEDEFNTPASNGGNGGVSGMDNMNSKIDSRSSSAIKPTGENCLSGNTSTGRKMSPSSVASCRSGVESSSETDVPTPNNEAEDLSFFVKDLLEQMQSRFNQMSETIVGRIDEMGNRVDDLEKSIAELMQQAGVEESDLRGGITGVSGGASQPVTDGLATIAPSPDRDPDP